MRRLAEELGWQVVGATWNSKLALSQVSVEAASFYRGIRIAKPQYMSVPMAVCSAPPRAPSPDQRTFEKCRLTLFEAASRGCRDYIILWIIF